MSDKKKERLIILADLFDKIPEDKQEGIVMGISMLAAAFETKKLSA